MRNQTVPRIGIGIVTYNRRDVLAATVEKLRRYTSHPDTVFVVADDGSTDGTLVWLRENNIPVVAGANMGIAWNKNRALYLLSEMLACDAVILLEDDTQPAAPGWDAPWIDAAGLWGHANFAAPWMQHLFLSGQGTPADPIMSDCATAQCAVYSRESLKFGGYYDSRFKGYGHEHVEHSVRLIRVGYGGGSVMVDGKSQIRFKLIHGALNVVDVPSYSNTEQAARNQVMAGALMMEQSYRAPWRDDSELKQFRSEITSALENRPNGFSLRGDVPGSVRRGWWRRRFGRRA